jgi:adenosylcobinamide-GDP ribazoletransferase
MPKELRLILAAVQFFTRLPVPARVGHGAEQLAQAARYLPLVGLLVGAIAAAALWLAAQVLPLPLAVTLSMAAGILATGAFHEDGLSDFADGMGGGHSREKALAIMKDPRAGSYGVIALVLALLMKFEALLALCETRSLALAAAALVAAHAVSRLMAASIMLTQDYVREDDSARARPAAQRMGATSFAVALLAGIVALGIPFAAGEGAAALFAAAGAALAMRAYLAWRLRKRLGGYTGDCLGAVQQLCELAFYLGLLAAL